MISFLIGLLAGLFGDALRSVLAPSTTDFLARKLAKFFPSLERKSNEEQNLRVLDVIQKAKNAGVDPFSVHFLDSKPQIFLERIGFSQAAFLEAEKLLPASQSMTQAEMTQEALLRAENAEEILGQLVLQIEKHPAMTPRKLRDFDAAQRAWWVFHRNMVMRAGGVWEGGSGEGMHRSLESEALTLERIGHLKQILHELGSA